MKKEKNWTREQYKAALRLMRRGVDCELMTNIFPHLSHVIKQADYSYQAWGYEPNGWVSEARRKRFSAIKYRITSSGEYLPF